MVLRYPLSRRGSRPIRRGSDFQVEGEEARGVEIRDVLWTSGWDSTFRVLDLVFSGATVRPWYVLSETSPRPSTRIELRAMRHIRKALRRHSPSAAERLLPVHVVRETSLTIDESLRTALRNLRDRYGTIADQYVFLAALADQLQMNMEIGLHSGGAMEDVLAGQLEPKRPHISARLKESAGLEFQRLFGRFEFPITDLTKQEMGEIARDQGFHHLMEKTWFCASPALGSPCGYCAPCRSARETGMEHRVGPLRSWKWLSYRTTWWRVKNPPKVLAQKARSTLIRMASAVRSAGREFPLISSHR